MTVTDGTPSIPDALARLPRVVDLLAARAEEHDRDATFPYQGIEAVHEAGLLTLTVGRRYGGPGAGLAETVHLLAQLGRGDASVAVLAADTLLVHAEQARTGGWPAALYRRLLTESRRGPALLNTLPGEPGEHPGTLARRDGTGWRLHGREGWCAGAEALAWMAVRARTDEDQPRTGWFLVRGDSPGIELDPVWDQLGLRAAGGQEVLLDDVAVAADAVVGLTPPGRKGEPAAEADRQVTTAWRELALSAVHLGVARAAQEWLVSFLGRRTPANLTEPLATLPRYRAAVAEIEVSLIGAEELLHGLAARIDRGERSAALRTGAAQLLINRSATAVVQQAVTLTGNPGLSRRHPLERYLRDLLTGRTHLPSEDTTLDALSTALL
ncbi:acyl-CoA dehydrogenase family protein [Kitasatospora sp. NPDC096147]|uniref:acyl-CoA dehydrogenase family protein n=1 Tax=Kitasatospora sp. NPDC096147 TaxID=3364093 RepID=UPI0038308B0A